MSQLVIQKSGDIDGGTVEYSVLPGDVLKFDAEVDVEIPIAFWKVKKHFSESQTYQGTAGLWARSNWDSVGKSVSLEGGTFTVIDCDATVAHVQINDTASSFSLSGLVTVDISGDKSQPITVLAVKASATVLGRDYQLLAHA